MTTTSSDDVSFHTANGVDSANASSAKKNNNDDEVFTGEHDDECYICDEGGELICCDYKSLMKRHYYLVHSLSESSSSSSRMTTRLRYDWMNRASQNKINFKTARKRVTQLSSASALLYKKGWEGIKALKLIPVFILNASSYESIDADSM